MTSEIQRVSVGLHGEPLYLLSSFASYLAIVTVGALCQHCACAVSGLIFSASVGFLQRKETLCILWSWGLPTHFREGHQTLGHTK